MLNAVYGWIKNLAFYLVIMTAVMEVLPGDTYKRYIRFFSGLVLILLVMTPVLKLTGSFDMYQEKYRRKEQELQVEIEGQRKILEEADIFEFFPEESLKGTESRTRNPEEMRNPGGIKVEEIRIGEDQEPDMEADTYRE